MLRMRARTPRIARPALRALPCAPCVTPDLIRYTSCATQYHETCLHHAVERGDVDVARVLLEAGADVAAKDQVQGAVPCSRGQVYLYVYGSSV